MIRVDGAEARVSTPEERQGVAYGGGKWTRSDAARWLYEARRGHANRVESLTLELTEERCVDTMSGARYPFSAVFTRDGSRVNGCALEGRKSAAIIPIWGN
jgi:uncharacterized membrane protein